MSEQKCEHKDPFVSGNACMRVGLQQIHPYGVPDIKAGCPCTRNLIIQKAACGMIAFKDCLTHGGSPIKYRELRLTLNLGEFKGIYSPVTLQPYPFYLHIRLNNPFLIDINIGRSCRFAKFRFEMKNWTQILRNMRETTRT